MFQITTTKAATRKWADDSEVKECMSCSKSFSVTIRRVSGKLSYILLTKVK